MVLCGKCPSLPAAVRRPSSSSATTSSLSPFLKGFSITGEADPSYDCVSFTVTADAPTKLQPSPALVALGGFEALDVFYRERNFCRLDRAPHDQQVTCVAVFGLADTPTHVALRAGHDEWWESKLGTGVRILHRLPELEGGRYGRIVTYYARESVGRDVARPEAQPGVIAFRP
jgi:hypothetical protein